MESDGCPVVRRPPDELVQDGRGPAAERPEINPAGRPLGPMGLRGEAAVEDQLAGELTGAFPPEFDEFQEGLVLGLSDEVGLALEEPPMTGLPGDQGPEAPLSPAVLGDLVFRPPRLMALIGKGWKSKSRVPWSAGRRV